MRRQTNNRRTNNISYPKGKQLVIICSNRISATKKGLTLHSSIQGVHCNTTSMGKETTQTYNTKKKMTQTPHCDGT
eukprot:12540259-Ditylum_brightwellii.AAC.1